MSAMLERLRSCFIEDVADVGAADPKPARLAVPARVVAVSELPGAQGSGAIAASIAVEASAMGLPGLLALSEPTSSTRATLLASASATDIESSLRVEPLGVAGLTDAGARGRVCFARIDPERSFAATIASIRAIRGLGLAAVHVPAERWRDLVDDPAADPDAAVLVGELPRQRAMAALCARELIGRGVRTRVLDGGLGRIAGRRSMAGLEAGGEGAGRARRIVRDVLAGQSGQAMPLALGAALALVLAALVLVAFGGAATAKGRLQRAADLAALSAARSMRDDHWRLFTAARRPDGTPNPDHLETAEYLRRAKLAARQAMRRNHLALDRTTISFPDQGTIAPVRARVRVLAEAAGTSTSVDAEAIASPAGTIAGGIGPERASGGGYQGPLEYRQGEPMRPDVARAFDRLSAAASRAGVTLTVNSGFRSDAEQAVLWNANPDPRWVARPGTSLHRCGTELDLGASDSYAWLRANASRFGFVQRYEWEAWHFGFTAGPDPCSQRANRSGGGDGRSAGSTGLPGFVPDRYRTLILRASARHDVSAALLAAQLMAESNFNPFAISNAGAVGIAQFMPATAAAYGLDDPLDPARAIDAQARLMADLLRRFGRDDLALAAYNAGPGAVESCACADPYAETAAYVTRILGLVGGGGVGSASSGPAALEVRLVE